MLEVIGAAPGSHSDIDWHETWRDSPEYQEVHEELDRLKAERPQNTEPASKSNDKASYREFAAPFWVQFVQTTKRVFEQYWRTPSYIYSKAALCVFAVRSLNGFRPPMSLLTDAQALFIGFSFFHASNTMQGLQNQMYVLSDT